MQDASDIHNKRKQHFFVFCVLTMIATFILVGFVDLNEDDIREFTIDLVVLGVLTASLITHRFSRKDMVVYRTTTVLICLAYFYSVSFGAGGGTVLYWTFFMPPLFFFFFGKWEGAVWAAAFFICVGTVMVLVSQNGRDIYSLNTITRFCLTFPIATVICFGLESSRHIFGQLLDDKNRLLREEKERLEGALKEIKTLSGLIPICANCKKVRNDEGYWEQVEIFVRKRSAADFSHSVCPDCIKILYPEYEKKVSKDTSQQA